MHHVPVCRTGNRHLCDSEIFIQTIQRRGRSASSCNSHSCSRFEFKSIINFITPRTVKRTVQEIINPSTGMCKIHRCCKNKTICRLRFFYKIIHTVIFKHTLSCFLTDITLQTIRDRLSAHLDHFGFYIFCVKNFFHFFDCCHCGSVGVAAAV